MTVRTGLNFSPILGCHCCHEHGTYLFLESFISVRLSIFYIICSYLRRKKSSLKVTLHTLEYVSLDSLYCYNSNQAWNNFGHSLQRIPNSPILWRSVLLLATPNFVFKFYVAPPPPSPLFFILSTCLVK